MRTITKFWDFLKANFWASLLAFLCLAAITAFAITATQRVFTGLESIGFEVFTLFTGITSSYFFSRQSAKNEAQAIIKPHARSAIRRLRSLYSSLGRVDATIQDCKSSRDYQVTLVRLEEIAFAQIVTADDALEEWADVVPEDVAELRKKLLTGDQGGVRNNG